MITREQALNADQFHYYNAYKHKCDIWRRNGQTKLWKTRPAHFQVPVKFGLYAYDYVDHTNMSSFHLPENCKGN